MRVCEWRVYQQLATRKLAHFLHLENAPLVGHNFVTKIGDVLL